MGMQKNIYTFAIRQRILSVSEHKTINDTHLLTFKT